LGTTPAHDGGAFAERFDMVVVGAGVVGCGVAHAIALRGMRVALVDRAAIGQGTSAHTFGWVNATSKVNDEAYHRLNAQGCARFRSLAAQWGAARIGLNPIGALEWASRSDGGTRLRALRERAERLEALGYDATWVTHRDLIGLEPGMRFPESAEGLLAPGDGWLDTPRFLDFLTEQLRAAGGRVLEHCRVRELLLDEAGTVTGLATDAGALHAPRVVLCTGAATPEVLSDLTGYDAFAIRFPLQLAPGLLLETPEHGGESPRHVLYCADAPELHMRRTPSGGLLMGADDVDGWIDESARSEAMQRGARELLRRAGSFLDSFPGEALLDACRSAVSVRPVPADGFTIAGPLPGAEGLYLVVTHSGVTLSLVIGELIADSVERGSTAPALGRCGLERFPGFA